MTVNIYLRDKNTDITALIAYISHPRRWKYYVGISVETRHWDSKKQRANLRHPNRIYINRVLDKIEQEVYQIWLDSRHQGKLLTQKEIKSKLDLVLAKKEDTRDKLISFGERFIRDQKGMKSSRTLQSYRSSLKRIRDYREDLSFDDIDLNFFYSFTSHLRDKGYLQNTIQGTIKNLKVLMNDANDRGLTKNINHKNPKFSVSRAAGDDIFLTERELEQLYRFRFESEKLDRVRDLFLILCWTGLRISDLRQVQLKNISVIENQDCLRVQQTKTMAWVTIPLHSVVMSVLHKYNFDLPVISDQKMNEYLKEMGQEVGLKDWQRIKTHTGRRSMVCNLYLAGFPETTIMKITGHTKYSSLQAYIEKLKTGDHIKLASKFWQNQKSILKVV